MVASQDQTMVEHGKPEFNAFTDTKRLLSSDCSTIQTEITNQSTTDNHGFTQKVRGTLNSGHVISSRQYKDSVENYDQMIDDYKQANLNRRLKMYLQFPFLKSEFDLINRNDWHLRTFSDFELHVKSYASQMGMAIGSAMACRGPVT